MAARWTQENDDYLRTWGYVGDFNMAMDLNRSRPAVRQRAKALGIILGQGGCDHEGADARTQTHCTCGAPFWPVHAFTAELDERDGRAPAS